MERVHKISWRGSKDEKVIKAVEERAGGGLFFPSALCGMWLGGVSHIFSLVCSSHIFPLPGPERQGGGTVS